ncbi:hypothetical protein ACFL09_01480 [Planctomycetota bacterium]
MALTLELGSTPPAFELPATPRTNPIGCSVKWDGQDAHWTPPDACDLV